MGVGDKGARCGVRECISDGFMRRLVCRIVLELCGKPTISCCIRKFVDAAFFLNEIDSSMPLLFAVGGGVRGAIADNDLSGSIRKSGCKVDGDHCPHRDTD
jgi:hypothetical protein